MLRLFCHRNRNCALQSYLRGFSYSSSSSSSSSSISRSAPPLKRKDRSKKSQSQAMKEILKMEKSTRLEHTQVNQLLSRFPLSSLPKLELSSFFHVLGKKSYSYPPEQLRLLNSTVLSDDNNRSLSPQCLGNIFYTLRYVNKARAPQVSPEVLDVLNSLLKRVENISLNNAALAPSRISSILFGLQNFPCNDLGFECSEVVRDILRALIPLIAFSEGTWTGSLVASSLYGLRGASSDVEEVRTIVSTLLNRCKDDKVLLEPQQVSKALYGMQCMNCDHSEVVDMLKFLEENISKHKDLLLKPQEVAAYLYGMNNMSAESPEVKNLLYHVGKYIVKCHDSFSGQHIGNSLYGMRYMSSDISEVRDVLMALEYKIKASTCSLSPQEACNAIYGLQNMSPSREAVSNILRELANKMEKSDGLYKGQEYSMALYGLNSMDNSHLEVRRILQILVERFDGSEIYNGQNISNSLFGLRNMSSSDETLKCVLQQIYSMIRSCNDELSAQNISISFYGLQNLNTDSSIVKSIVAKLSRVFESSEAISWSNQELGCILYGLKNMSSADSDVRRVVATVDARLKRSNDTMTPQSIAEAIYGLRSMNCESTEVRSILGTLCNKLYQVNASSWDAVSVSSILAGLQSMSVCDEVNGLLKAVSDVSFENSNASLQWGPEEISCAFWGLRNKSTDKSTEVLRILHHLTDLLKTANGFNGIHLSKIVFSMRQMKSSCPEVKAALRALSNVAKQNEINGEVFASCLFGLQNMSCGDAEVLDMMRALCDSAETEMTVNMTPLNIANAFYGLKSMSCECDEVRRVLLLLCDATIESQDSFDAQSLSTSFAGLRGCHDNCAEALDALRCLCERADKLRGALTPLQLTNMFSGLRGMSSANQDTRRLLHILGEKIKANPNIIDGDSIGEILYGMQRMNVEHPEVRATLSILCDRLHSKTASDESTCEFGIHSVGASLYALASISQIHLATTQDQSIGHIMDRMKSAGVIFHLVDRILDHGAQASMKFMNGTKTDGVTPHHLSNIMRSLNLLECFLPQLPSSSLENIRLIRSNMSIALSQSTDFHENNQSQMYLPSPLVESAYTALKKHFADRESISVRFNDIMDHFECDILVKELADNSSGGEVKRIVNIEVEGHQHKLPVKRRFSFLRDSFLKSYHDIDIIRIHEPSSNLEKALERVVEDVSEKFKSR